MDVSVPYEAVVPSLDGAVLEVLARAGKPLTGRQVQRLARRGSVPGVATVLARLAESGIVHVDHAGSAHLYQANRDHLAWPAVETLVAMRETLIGRLVDAVATWSVRPTKAVLFGSTARGDGDVDSDVDILIVHPRTRSPEEVDVDGLRDGVRRWTGNHAQLVVVTETLWQRMEEESDPLVDSVRRDGIDLLVRAGVAA